MPHRLSSLIRVAAAAASLAGANPATAQDHHRSESVLIEVAAEETPCAILGLLTTPPAWSPGDAAAIVVAGDVLAPPAHDRLVAALLGEDTAVLEFAAAGPCRDVQGRAVWQQPLERRLAAGLEALRIAAAPGLVVGFGDGVAAGPLLAMTRDSPGQDAAPSQPLHAVVAVGDALGGTVVRAGARPPAAERSELRWPHLCAMLGRTLPVVTPQCLAALTRPVRQAAIGR